MIIANGQSLVNGYRAQATGRIGFGPAGGKELLVVRPINDYTAPRALCPTLGYQMAISTLTLV
jgi:hypothetical protein